LKGIELLIRASSVFPGMLGRQHNTGQLTFIRPKKRGAAFHIKS